MFNYPSPCARCQVPEDKCPGKSCVRWKPRFYTRDAWVCGDAEINKSEHYLVVGPAGSRHSFTTFFRTKKKEMLVSCGCFLGDLDAFLEKVKRTHGDNKYAKEYFAAAELAKVHIDLGGDDGES